MAMTTSEIGDILYTFLTTLSVKDVERGWNLEDGEVGAERVTLSVKPVSYGRKWGKAYAEVNVCVPDLPDGDADLIRLSELEGEYSAALGFKTGVAGGTPYRFRRESVGLMEDRPLRLHYANIRVIFEFLNTLELWQDKYPQ